MLSMCEMNPWPQWGYWDSLSQQQEPRERGYLGSSSATWTDVCGLGTWYGQTLHKWHGEGKLNCLQRHPTADRDALGMQSEQLHFLQDRLIWCSLLLMASPVEELQPMSFRWILKCDFLPLMSSFFFFKKKILFTYLRERDESVCTHAWEHDRGWGV